MIQYISFELKLVPKKCELDSQQLADTIKHILLNSPNLNFDSIEIIPYEIVLGASLKHDFTFNVEDKLDGERQQT